MKESSPREKKNQKWLKQQKQSSFKKSWSAWRDRQKEGKNIKNSTQDRVNA